MTIIGMININIKYCIVFHLCREVVEVLKDLRAQRICSQ